MKISKSDRKVNTTKQTYIIIRILIFCSFIILPPFFAYHGKLLFGDWGILIGAFISIIVIGPFIKYFLH